MIDCGAQMFKDVYLFYSISIICHNISDSTIDTFSVTFLILQVLCVLKGAQCLQNCCCLHYNTYATRVRH